MDADQCKELAEMKKLKAKTAALGATSEQVPSSSSKGPCTKPSKKKAGQIADADVLHHFMPRSGSKVLSSK